MANSLDNLSSYYLPNTLDGINIISDEVSSNALLVDGSNNMLADLNVSFHNVKNLDAGIDVNDAVNLGQLNGVSSASKIYSDNVSSVSRLFSNSVSSSSFIYSNSVSSASKLYADIVGNNVSSSSFIYSNSVSSASRIYSNTVSSASYIFATTQSSLKVSKAGDTMTGNLNMGTNYISSDVNPLLSTHLARKSYVDTKVPISGGVDITGNLGFGNSYRIINLVDGFFPQDSATVNQVNTMSNNVSSSSFIYANSVSSSSKLYADTVTNNVSSSSFIYANTELNLKVKKDGDTMTGDLRLPMVRLIGQTVPLDFIVDETNRTNTYIYFEAAGATSDFAYLRQIGGSDNIHLTLDFHNNTNDGNFSLRSVNSNATPDDAPVTFFKSNPTQTDVKGLLTSDSLTVAGSASLNSSSVTNNLSVGGTITANTTITINGGTTDNYSWNVDIGNRTNTYLALGPAGASTDWAYLRQIGGDNDYHLSLDIHDDATDGRVSFRTVESTATPDNVKTFFRATATRGFFNPNGLLVRSAATTGAVSLDNYQGVTTVKYRGSVQHGNLTLPSGPENGVRIEIMNSSSNDLTVQVGNGAHFINGNTGTTSVIMGHPEMMVLIFYNLSWEGTKWNTEI